MLDLLNDDISQSTGRVLTFGSLFLRHALRVCPFFNSCAIVKECDMNTYQESIRKIGDEFLFPRV